MCTFRESCRVNTSNFVICVGVQMLAVDRPLIKFFSRTCTFLLKINCSAIMSGLLMSRTNCTIDTTWLSTVIRITHKLYTFLFNVIIIIDTISRFLSCQIFYSEYFELPKLFTFMNQMINDVYYYNKCSHHTL